MAAEVLAVPRADCTKEEVYKYAETINFWLQFLKGKELSINISDRTYEALFECNLYPCINNLKRVFSTHKDIIGYDAPTVARNIDTLFQSASRFEEQYKVEEIRYDNVCMDPDLAQSTEYDELYPSLERSILSIAFLREYCSEELKRHQLVLKKTAREQIEVRAEIKGIDHSRADLPEFSDLLGFFQGATLVCESSLRLLKHLDERAILTQATRDTEVRLAIQVALCKDSIGNGIEPVLSDGDIFCVGDKFREKCQDMCDGGEAALPGRIIRAIVKVLRGRTRQVARPFRVSSGANSPTRMRGRDELWRANITGGPRLHYWKLPDGRIELVSVNHHDDLRVP